MAGLSAGTLDREVTIQQLTESVGVTGFPVEAWTTLAIEWMSKSDRGGTERFRADQLSAPSQTLWRLHYRDDMDPDAVDVAKTRRLVYQGRVYDIVSCSELGRQEGIELITLARKG